MDVIEDFVEELNTAVKTQCIAAFEGGNHAQVVRLLPCVQEPKKLAPWLLHVASSRGWADLVKELITKYGFDPACPLARGSTPVHEASRNGHIDVVRLLTQNFESPPDSIDDYGYTPLLLACEEGQLDVVVFLTTEFKCDVNARHEKSGENALLCACRAGNLEIIEYLITSCKADVQAKTAFGDTVLHLACIAGNLEIIQYLISVCKANVQAKNLSGDTVLHCACRSGNLESIQYLILVCKADVLAKNVMGDTPVHDCGNPHAVRYLCSMFDTVVSIKGSQGMTPLHYACRDGWTDVVNYFIEEKHCDPRCCQDDGWTPLHFACELKQVEVVEYLLSTGKVDPMATSSSGIIPLELAGGNYKIYSLFAPFESCRVSFPVDSVAKVFHLGNSAAGKSSLARVLFEHTRHASEHKFIACENVSGVEEFTAGIIPLYVEHCKAGNLMLYDFAGHPEFYSSHSAILGGIMKTVAGIFVLMVDLSSKREDIAKQLHYWMSFIDSESSYAHSKSQVIVVGSHADVLEGGRAELERRSKLVEVIAKREIKRQAFLGFVPLDCRKLASDGLDQYIALLARGCKEVLANTPVISLYCHVLYAFLKTKLNVPAMVLESLSIAVLAEKNSSLPPDMNVLVSLLTL